MFAYHFITMLFLYKDKMRERDVIVTNAELIDKFLSAKNELPERSNERCAAPGIHVYMCLDLDVFFQ